MHMFRHYNSSMKLVAFFVIVQATLEHEVASFWRERLCVPLAEGHEDGSSGFLVVRQHAPVFVHSLSSLMLY